MAEIIAWAIVNLVIAICLAILSINVNPWFGLPFVLLILMVGGKDFK